MHRSRRRPRPRRRTAGRSRWRRRRPESAAGWWPRPTRRIARRGARWRSATLVVIASWPSWRSPHRATRTGPHRSRSSPIRSIWPCGSAVTSCSSTSSRPAHTIPAAFTARPGSATATRRISPDRPLTLASYVARALPEAYVEHLAAGEALPDMPLFLTPTAYINIPLEPTYQAAYRGPAGHADRADRTPPDLSPVRDMRRGHDRALRARPASGRREQGAWRVMTGRYSARRGSAGARPRPPRPRAAP